MKDEKGFKISHYACAVLLSVSSLPLVATAMTELAVVR